MVRVYGNRVGFSPGTLILDYIGLVFVSLFCFEKWKDFFDDAKYPGALLNGHFFFFIIIICSTLHDGWITFLKANESVQTPVIARARIGKRKRQWNFYLAADGWAGCLPACLPAGAVHARPDVTFYRRRPGVNTPRRRRELWGPVYVPPPPPARPPSRATPNGRRRGEHKSLDDFSITRVVLHRVAATSTAGIRPDGLTRFRGGRESRFHKFDPSALHTRVCVITGTTVSDTCPPKNPGRTDYVPDQGRALGRGAGFMGFQLSAPIAGWSYFIVIYQLGTCLRTRYRLLSLWSLKKPWKTRCNSVLLNRWW